jgi:hypothetical protein
VRLGLDENLTELRRSLCLDGNDIATAFDFARVHTLEVPAFVFPPCSLGT